MENTNIIHVHLREPAADYYFGSLAAIYDVLPEPVVGIKYTSLRSCFAKLGGCYTSPKCIIKRGQIHRKRSNCKS